MRAILAELARRARRTLGAEPLTCLWLGRPEAGRPSRRASGSVDAVDGGRPTPLVLLIDESTCWSATA